jgi:hypothetical protein
MTVNIANKKNYDFIHLALVLRDIQKTKVKIPTILETVGQVYIEMNIKKSVPSKIQRDPMQQKLNEYMDQFIEKTMGSSNSAEGASRVSPPPEAEKIPKGMLELLIEKLSYSISFIKSLLEKYPHLLKYLLFLLSILSLLLVLWKKKSFQKILEWFKKSNTSNNLFEGFEGSKKMRKYPQPPVKTLDERESEKAERLRAARELLKKLAKSKEKLAQEKLEKLAQRKEPKIIQNQPKLPEIVDLPVKKNGEEKLNRYPFPEPFF